MLNKVEVENFLSHASNNLQFNHGVTVFVGQNGAGKSSIIDAITFALFGKHTRNSNKGLIRRGSNQAYVKVDFSIRDRQFQAVRKIDAKGSVTAQLFEKQENNFLLSAEGERKQYGESMTHQIETLLGLNFEKLKVASIVRQGELNSIIDSEPREFKELINAIIGIDKLDVAFENMKDIIERFRLSIKSELGHDDGDIASLKKKLDSAALQIEEFQPKLDALITLRKTLENELQNLQRRVSSYSAAEIKMKELEKRRLDFRTYVKNAFADYKKRIEENERRLFDCEGCFEYALLKNELETKITSLKNEQESVRVELLEMSRKLNNFEGQKEIAGKLTIKDGKCPVCDSKVGQLNPMFQIEHIQNEVEWLRKNASTLTEKEHFIEVELRNLEKDRDRSLKAESMLSAYNITKQEDLESLKKEITNMKTHVEKISFQLDTSDGLLQLSAFDENSENMIRAISRLEQETKGFSMSELNSMKANFKQMELKFRETLQEIGKLTTKLEDAKVEKTEISETLKELDLLKKYVTDLDEVRKQIFNREGPVAVSLRSWALNAIGQKASEYLSAFNVKIQRILLHDKKGDIGISCYSGNTELDLKSLSGGEKVSVALAIRLGMAQLLGASNLNFIILDEPTTHLDEERRKSLVSILSNAFESNLGGLSQFIIITHDSEIFENSNVDTIYNFQATLEGTKVTAS